MNLINNAVPFDLLRILIAVAESKNFREAAEKMHLSQPGISVKIKELEALQPIPLFNIEGKKKVLTHFGRSLYEIAKTEAVRFDRKIENLHRIYSTAELLTLRIAGRNEVLEHIAPFLDFDGKIEIFNCSSRDAIDRLLKHQVDIAISHIRPDSTEILAKKLLTSTVSFCVHKKFLQKKLNLDLIKNQDFLMNTPCVSFLKDSQLSTSWGRFTNIPFQSLQIKFVAEDWRTVESLISRGMGYGIMPSYIKCSCSDVQRFEIPESIMSSLNFYAMFESSLKKIEGFKKILTFNNFK